MNVRNSHVSFYVVDFLELITLIKQKLFNFTTPLYGKQFWVTFETVSKERWIVICIG